MITRRRLLVSAGLLTTAIGISAWELSFDSPAEGYAVLSEHELEIVGSIAQAMFPGIHMPLNGIQAEVPRRVDKNISTLFDTKQLTGFRYVLRTLEYGALASHELHFTSLDSKVRLEILESWWLSGILVQRLFVDILRAILGMAYFSHPEILKAIGWDLGCQKYKEN